MSALSAASRNERTQAEEASTTGARARARARTNHRLLVNGLRIAFAVVVLGFWEIGTTIDATHHEGLWIDPFFYGRPSGIASQLWTWITTGTAQGPLWLQVATTLEEAFLGFLIGVVLGVIFGVALGRVRLLSDVFAPYIKALNAMPRVVLGSIFIITIGYNIWSKVALVGAVVGEYLGAIHGIGLVIATAQSTFNPNGVFAAMFILAVVALTAEVALTWLENRLIKWRPNTLEVPRI